MRAAITAARQSSTGLRLAGWGLPFVEIMLAKPDTHCSKRRSAAEGFFMSKSWVVLAFLPFVMACAGTPATETAARECKVVQQDTTESLIKVKKECSSTGTSGDNLHQNELHAPE
jgi:hypothetical protein